MLELESFKNQLKFFEYLDAGVYAFRLMSEGKAKNFAEGIRRGKKAPLIDSIYGSNILLARDVLTLSLMRRSFMFTVRERQECIDYSSLEKDKEYIELKKEIFKDDKALTEAECQKLLKQLGNAIAHGETLKSFDLEYYKKIMQEYSKGIHRHDIEDQMQSTILKLNYQSIFQIDETGKRVRRPHPVRTEIAITMRTLTKLTDLINDGYIKADKRRCVGYAFTEDFSEVAWVDEKHRDFVPIKFDEVQQETYNFVIHDYWDYVAQHAALNINFANQIVKVLPQVDACAGGIALHRVLVDEEHRYLKMRDMFDITTVFELLKSDQDQIMDYIYKKNIVVKKTDLFNTMRACYNCRFDNLYKEMLMIEVVNLLEEIESNDLKEKVFTNSPAIKEIASEVFEKDEKELTDKENRTILNHFRNSLTHGTYINGIEDRIEIYDHKSSTEKTPEHKFTAYVSDFEELKDLALNALKEKEKELERKVSSTETE